MTDFLTTLPWGWYALALVLCVIAIYGAAYYMANQPPRGIDYELSNIDDDMNRGWR